MKISVKLTGKEENDIERFGKLCPACYLFGCSGWKRRFRLDILSAIQNLTVPIHFRTTINSHQKWLGRIFNGVETARDEYDLTNVKVYYWDDSIDAISLSYYGADKETEYIKGQTEGLIKFISDYGFISAKAQYGFGQILVDVSRDDSWEASFHRLYKEIKRSKFRDNHENSPKLPSIDQAVFLAFNIPTNDLRGQGILDNKSHYGLENKKEKRYIPCSFDIRYKGIKNLGFRVWLEKRLFSEKPTKEEKKKLDILLGAVARKGYPLSESDRRASQVFFGMPVKNQEENYSLRVVAFLPHNFQYFNDVSKLSDTISEYIKETFSHSQLSFRTFGRDIVAKIKQGE